MTKATSTRLLKHYKEVGYKQAYENMKEHIEDSRKFTDEEKKALFSVEKPKTPTKTNSKE